MMIVVAAIALLFLLFELGWLPVSIKRSSTFVGSMGRRCEASFTSTTGKLFRVLRFRESRSYSFCLTARVQQGEMAVQILDRQRIPVLTLTPASPNGVFAARAGEKYYLVIRFQNASGSYQLDWS